MLPEKYPELLFYFSRGDMQTQIINLGLPAPIDIQGDFGSRQGRDPPYAIAQKIERRLLAVPGAVDIHIQQRMDQPALRIDVDRDRTAKMATNEGIVRLLSARHRPNVLMEAAPACW